MKKIKMNVQIWSDITCPFCYIAKRKFESALSQFEHADGIEIIWKSFELAPGFQTEPDKSIYQLLIETKGVSLEQAVSMSDQVAATAREVGLEYNFHKVIPANSFNGHRFLHLAKEQHLKDQAKERLFKAYFTEGRNIDSIPTLMELGKEIGLDPTEIKRALESDQFKDEVNQDILEAKNRGITSVPAYVFDDKLAVFGAQDSKAFLKILEKAYAEWQIENSGSMLTVTDGQSCKIGENC